MEAVRQRKAASAEPNDSVEDVDGPQETQSNSYHGYLHLKLKFIGGLICAILLILLYLELFVTSPIEPEAFTFDPIPKFEGPLAPNNELKTIEKINVNEYKGPESLAFYKGKIYTGVSDGRIIEIDIVTHKIRNVIKTLGRPPCGGFANEKHCGRPLGLRVKNGYIYTVDAYLGLFKINIATGERTNLYKASEPLPDGYPPKFLNDIEVDNDGNVYMTDSSYQFTRVNHPYVGFEGSAKGRLIMFDSVTNTTQILLRKLYAPNGVQLTPDGNSLLISETTRSRITRYFLRGQRLGDTEVFANNLPGLLDNLRPSCRGGYWVSLAVTRHPDKWSSWDLTSPYPWVRRLMAKTFSTYAFLRTLPVYGLVLELDENGQIVRSLHDQDGKVMPSSSEVLEHQGYLYLGSFQLPFLAKYKLPTEPTQND